MITKIVLHSLWGRQINFLFSLSQCNLYHLKHKMLCKVLENILFYTNIYSTVFWRANIIPVSKAIQL